MSQAQLGELVGRSASSIRSWERDVSIPTDPSVITALSAILDIDGRALFDKAGVDVPAQESHPTVEQAFASLAPLPLEDPIEDAVRADPAIVDEPEEEEAEIEPGEVELDADSELEQEVHEHLDQAAAFETPRAREPEPVVETFSLPAEETPIGERVAAETGSEQQAAFVSPPEPYVITAPTPPVVEPSYIEDSNQRQIYRVRNLATVALVVILVIVFLWSIGNTLDAIGTWWDEFTGNLRL